MTEEQNQPPPDDSSEGDPSPTAPDADLDDLLAQAGELADRLSVELGVDEEDVTMDAPSEGVLGQAEEPTSLDDELAQLEGLVDTASHEVGPATSEPPAPPVPKTDAPPASPEPSYDQQTRDQFAGIFEDGNLPPPLSPEVLEQALTPTDGSKNKPSAPDPSPKLGDENKPDAHPATPAADATAPTTMDADEDVPDFMREFMEPTAESQSESEPEPPQQPQLPEAVIEVTPVPVQTKPGVVGTGLLQSVVRPPEEAHEDPLEEGTPAAPPEVSRWAALRTRLMHLLAQTKQITLLGPLAGRVGYAACELVLKVLERVDRPVERYGWRAKRIAGWAAMATFGTSAVVYILSML